MPICIYCNRDKSDEEMSLEHVFPQSMGGSCLPDKFKTNRVCNFCNSNLGRFVDASFEKSWPVSNWLQQTAMACFDPLNPEGLPLFCTGTSKLAFPCMSEDEVCEAYIGPLGETVYWIRPDDEKFYWYSGGNPQTTKEVESRAYFCFSVRSEKNPTLTLKSFKEAFKRKSVRKIFATEVQGLDLQDVGFSSPDELDQKRIEFLWKAKNGLEHTQIAMNIQYDIRFLAKLARGFSFCLFGDKALTGSYSEEVRKAIWYRGSGDVPEIRGLSTLSSLANTKGYLDLTGIDQAFTVIFANLPEGIALNLNLGTRLTATILCAESAVLDEKDRKMVGTGIVLVLFPFIKKYFQFSFPDYLAIKNGHLFIPEWDQLQAKLTANQGYFSELK